MEIFLDRLITKKDQLRIIVGILCLMILYTILINVVDTISVESSHFRKIFFNTSNALVFLYLYKYIRYDLKLKLSFAFISIEVLITIYYLVLSLYKLIQGIASGDTDFGTFEQTYPYEIGMSVLRIISIMGIAIQLLLNNFFVKKIKVVIKLLGVSFLLQFVGSFAIVYLIGMLYGTTVESAVIDNLYTWSYLFFSIIPQVSMVCLYVLALDQNYADVPTEEEL